MPVRRITGTDFVTSVTATEVGLNGLKVSSIPVTKKGKLYKGANGPYTVTFTVVSQKAAGTLKGPSSSDEGGDDGETLETFSADVNFP